MTNEERNQIAIDAMKFFKQKLNNGIYGEFVGNFDTAISALEKQIPKNPLHWDDCEQFYIECPCCGKRYDSRLGYKGCPYCLQAIRLE